MAWFGFKSDRKPINNSGKKQENESSLRIDVEDLTDQGFTCEEIAQELGVDKERVYRIREARKRRDLRAQGRATDETPSAPTDPIKEMRIELEKLKLEREKIELQAAIDRRKREIEEEDADEDDILEEVVKEVQPEDKFLQMAVPVFMQFMAGGQKPAALTVTPPPNTNTPQQANDSSEMTAAALPPPQLTDEEINKNADFILGKIPKAFRGMALSQLSQFNDTDILRMKNAMLAKGAE